ncbi:MAG: 30S ribosomal protein S17 [Candidatus Cloacimonadota bacterium]|nr:MAG: 30S ribosomal protein S17 [Candidatus Cloacimonadota bacterium]
MEQVRKAPKLISGVVSSTAMQKTAKLEIIYIEQHPLYKKHMKRKKTLLFHDENEVCKVGDTVNIVECRPLSKSKHYRFVGKVENAS